MNLTSLAWKVWFRNFTVWKRTWLTAVVGSFGEPVLYFVAIGYGLGSFVRPIGDIPYIEFLAPAILASAVMNAASFETTYVSYTRMTQQHSFDAIMATPVSVEEIVLAEILWGMTKAVFAGMVMLGVAAFLGFVNSWIVLWVIPLLFVQGFLFAGLGLLMSSVATSYDHFTYYFTLFLEPMFLFSGTFFPLSVLPEILQRAVWVLPLTHPVYLYRSLFQGTPPTSFFFHIIWMLILGLLIFFWTARRLKRRLLS
jgi:lipooligosaccharide transport system permease protein